MNPETLQILFAFADKSKSAFGDLARNALGAASAVGKAAQDMASFGGQIVGEAANIATAIAAAGAAIGAFATQNYAALDSMTRGLATVSENAQQLQAQLSDLKEIAKLPGLGLAEAAKGSLALQSVGLSARDAERALMAFGNAIAAAGGGKEQLGSVIKGLSDIVAVNKITMDNIRQISQAAPQVRNFMSQAFGTSDGQELTRMGVTVEQFVSGIIEQAERLPKVTGGLQNAFENFGDLLKDSFMPLGAGIGKLFEAATPGIENFFAGVKKYANIAGEVFASVADSGVLTDVFAKISAGFNNLVGANFEATFRNAFTHIAAGAASIFATLPQAIASARDYLSQLTPVLMADAGMVFSYVGQVWDVVRNNVTELFGYIQNRTTSLVTFFAEVMKGIAPLVGQFLSNGVKGVEMMAKTLEKIAEFTNTGAPGLLPGLGLAPQITALLDPARAPNFKSLPEFPQLKALPMPNADAFNLLKYQNQYEQQIKAAMKPLPTLPDGLIFGGNPGMAGNGGPLPLLVEISRNTRGTKDALDNLNLRRQVYGGGANARFGVTAAELNGGALPANAYGGGYGNVGYASASGGTATSELDRILRQYVDEALARKGVGGRRPGRG